jgi:hypothetical protein
MSGTLHHERPPARAHPDYSRAVLEDLYRYRRKRQPIAWALWLLTGWLGGHRFYLDRTGTGVLMLFTGGGMMVWWLIDGFRLPAMIAAYNGEQARREREGLPPVSLAFMPPVRERSVSAPPEWATRRAGRVRLMGDVLVLLLSGTLLGAVSANTANFEAVTAIVALIAITNLGARWERLADLPLLRALDRWSHRLRLFYHWNDPGGPLSLLLRPITGLFAAFFRKRARAEVRLYLQLGGVFAVMFTLIDVISLVATSGSLDGAVDDFVEDMALTFVSVYAFATPIGATLTTHVLLGRTDVLLWLLSGLTIAALALGLFA